ncbi:MAG: PIG-L family deacetylase [Bacteroidales bacterium]|nr:PIG-L family deacetylase [Bacteroidales bacterium]
MKKFFACVVLGMMAMVSYAQAITDGHYKKCLVIGAHPDDPESMSGGTMLALKDLGCEVVSVYFTRGEGGIVGKSATETAQIRSQEALDACREMGVRAVFLSQVDGASYVNAEAYAEMLELIKTEKPDLVLTHWPIDSHRDHRNCSILVYDAWRRSGYSFDLYYGEVMTGLQTQNFHPDTWVDISKYRDQKLKAYLMHVSQNTDGNIEAYHDPMEQMRGLEYRCKYAEGYVKQQKGR